MRQLCSVLALAAAVAATVIASAQQFGPVSRDIRTGVYRGQAVTYEVIDGLAIWDGDIILGTPEELSPAGGSMPAGALDSPTKLSSVSDKKRLWPNGIVPYVIDPELTNPHVPLAIRHWEQNTPIRFVERTDQPNWVRFEPGNICSAAVGMIGGEQSVSLPDACGPGTVVHEIGHAVGLYHEHQRNDRDPYVWVWSDPLGSNALYYNKVGPYAVASDLYDYGSVMHYTWIGAMETIPPGIVLGSGGPHLGGSSTTGLSAGDIDGVNRLYGRIPTRTTVSANVVGLLIEVDGRTYTAPHRFDWEPGSIHTIGVASPQKLGIDYYRYLFAKWSDGGAQTHSVTASSETTVFIANFIEQIRPEPSAHPPEGGAVRFDPPSVDGFYTRDSFIKVIAEPAEGFSFEHWRPRYFHLSGGYSSNPALVRAGQRYPAYFTRRPLTTIDTTVPGSRVLVDGSMIRLPTSFAWEAGSTHTLGFVGHTGEAQFSVGVPGRLIFNGWSDGGDATHDITVSEEPTTITANFTRQLILRKFPHGPGAIEVQPSSSEGRFHDLSTTVQLTARPAPGSKFISWQGDLSGTENPQSLLMDSYKWVRAFFIDEQSFETARLTSGKPFLLHLLFGPAAARPESYNGYWIDVPRGATQLDIRLVTATPGADGDLYVNRDSRPSAVFATNNNEIVRYESEYSSTGPGGDETITITPASSPPLEPGPYFIAVNARTLGAHVKRTLTADLTVSDEEIAANIPHFGIPASLIMTIEGETPAPQSLEIHNSGQGTLDYQIATDQSWLSVWPDQGSSAGETDTVEITVDPTNLEPGAFDGTITITEWQPAGILSSLASDHTPVWPVTIPVTLIVIPESGEDSPSDTTPSFAGDGGPAVDARLSRPTGVTVDAAGNLYIADSGNHRIRRVDPSGIITTIAGTGEEGFSGDSGPATEAQLRCPSRVATDGSGNLYIADRCNARIRKVDPAGIITTVAGTGERGDGGDGGPATEAQLRSPNGVATDGSGNLYIADFGNFRIRRVDSSGIITTIAGTGEQGFSGDGGQAIDAQLGNPIDVTVDAAGNLYIADQSNRRIRRVDSSGTISTVVGNGASGFSGDFGPATEARLRFPSSVAADAAGNLYIADTFNYSIRRVDSSGTISTVAGNRVPGFSGDSFPAIDAQLEDPIDVTVDAAGNLYIADQQNHRIRRVDPAGIITTVAGR